MADSPVGHEGAPHDGVDGRDAHQHEQQHQVHVRGEVGHELDDGHLVVLVAQRQREHHPHGRAQDEGEEEQHGPPRRPLQGALPEFLRVSEKNVKTVRMAVVEW